MTRLWLSGTRIRMKVDSSNIPCQLVWLNQSHSVRHIYNRWRVDTEWWNQRIWREYLLLDTTSGLLVVVYRDLMNDDWYLQRLYD